MKSSDIKLLTIAVFISSLSLAGINKAENATNLDQIELEQLEAEIDALTDEADVISTLEKDTDKIAEDLMAGKEEEKDKKPEIIPQKCFLKAIEEDPIHFAVCNNGNTILDKITGLMWDRCSYGKTWNEKKQFCEGDANRYNWQNSLLTIRQLNKDNYNNKSDWRLPNIKELSSLVDTRCMNPSIDMRSFPEKYMYEFTPGRYDYWTSSVMENSPQRAWAVDFNLGQDYPNNKHLSKNIRLVRLGSAKTSYDIALGKDVSLDEQCVTYPSISFSHVINVPTESEIISDELVIVFSGINQLPLTIHNGEYQVNSDGNWLTTDGILKNNDKLKLRHISAKEFLTDTETTVKVGHQVAVFKSTTLEGAAEAFNDYLTDQGGALYDSMYDDFLKGLNDTLSDIDIHFDTNLFKLTPEIQENIVKYFDDNKALTDKIKEIQLIGHTDSVASKQYNMALSLRRASEVFNFIRLLPGLESVKITYRGAGFDLPIGDNNTEEGRAKNRRVDVMVIYEE